jgi:uncharacterized protein (TIGR02271 family)
MVKRSKRSTNEAEEVSSSAIAHEGSSIESANTVEQYVVPVIEEQAVIGKRAVEAEKVRLQKLVHTREERIDEPLLREEIEVERVPHNEIVTEAQPVRYEGDVMIVPVYEEVLVVEKRLRLKEELRITRRQGTYHDPQTIMLREEEVIVTHEDLGRRYGVELQNNDRFRHQEWDAVEHDAQIDWERQYPESPWEQVKDAVRSAWDIARGRR